MMEKISQNKKIAISAVSLFMVSLSIMAFFLGGNGGFSGGGANVMGHGGESKTAAEESHIDEIAEGEDALDNKYTFSTDVSGVILEASPEFCKFLNENCKNLIKKKLFDYLNKEDLSDLASIFGKLAQKEQKMNGIGPFTLENAQRDQKFVLLNAQTKLDKEGKVARIEFSVKDITDKLEKAKADAEKEGPGGRKNWMRNIYPKIKNSPEKDDKLLVKVSYKK